MITKTTPGLIHAIATCHVCDFYESDYLIAAKKALEHVKKTGHKVAIERGTVQYIESK